MRDIQWVDSVAYSEIALQFWCERCQRHVHQCYRPTDRYFYPFLAVGAHYDREHLHRGLRRALHERVTRRLRFRLHWNAPRLLRHLACALGWHADLKEVYASSIAPIICQDCGRHRVLARRDWF